MNISKIKNNLLHYLPEVFWPYRRTYNNTLSMIQNVSAFDKKEIEKWQFERFRYLVNFTWSHSNGYRQFWSGYGFNPKHLRSIDDIDKIPLINKKIMQADIDLFSTNFNKNKLKVSTGGSSGVPFSFYNSKYQRTIEESFINSIWGQFYPEISRKTPRTILRGGVIEDGINHDPLFGLRLSSRDITPLLVKKFVHEIDKAKTPIFHVYPSSLYIVSKMMLEEGLERPKHKFKMICFGSEPLYQFQMETIKRVFNEPHCFWYGSTEKVVLAGNCKNNDVFHVYPQYGITEILRKDGSSAKQGEIGEIVGSSFWGLDTPFIRYQTGDIARVGTQGCPACGVNYQLLENIEGRAQEFVIGYNNSLLSMTYVNAHDDIFESISQFRFKQDTVGVVEFLFVRKENCSPNIEDIMQRLSVIFGRSFTLVPKEVQKIPLTKVGKMSFLEQSLDMSIYL